MSRTLNYTVQRVLEKLNLDPVNSIGDSEDSLLVAREAETTYYDLLTRGEWKANVDLLEVESMSDLNNPTALRLPDNVSNISSMRYDITGLDEDRVDYRSLIWLSPEEFLEKCYTNDSSKDNVTRVLYKGKPLFVVNDKMPLYYTSLDNETIILDSWDKNVEDTVNGSKTLCYGETEPSWLETDDFVIPVQSSVYPLYLSMLSAACAMYLNSTISQEDERRQARGISRMRREQNRTELEYFPKFHYGRKGNGLT